MLGGHYIPLGSFLFAFLHRIGGGVVGKTFNLSPRCERCKLRHYKLDRLIKAPARLRTFFMRFELMNRHHIAEANNPPNVKDLPARRGGCGCSKNVKKSDKVKANNV